MPSHILIYIFMGSRTMVVAPQRNYVDILLKLPIYAMRLRRSEALGGDMTHRVDWYILSKEA